MISVNRRRVAELEGRYPSVRFECVDVRSAKDVEALVRGLTASGELPDVFILNAGINRLDNDEAFDLPLYREVIDTNLFGVLNFIAPLTQVPAVDVERHVVAISSMVAYAGNPYGLGYQTSKQALTTCFDVWSNMYDGDGPGLQTGHPGTRCHLDLHDGREAPRLDGPDQEPLFRIAGRHGPRDRALCATRKKKLVHPWRAVALFGAVRLARWLVPGFIQGQRTLAGRPRRKAG